MSVKKFKLKTTVNGKNIEKEIPSNMLLSDFLRNVLFLTGTKVGCEEGECGACIVCVDGKPINSCLYLAVQTHNKEVLTIEGLQGENGEAHVLAKSFDAAGAVQCGFCTPGMIMMSYALLKENPNPTRDEIKRALSGNICRCTGYEKIVQAVEAAKGKV